MPIIKSVRVDKVPDPESIKKTPTANSPQLAKFKVFLTSIFIHVHYMHSLQPYYHHIYTYTRRRHNPTNRTVTKAAPIATGITKCQGQSIKIAYIK